MGILDKLRPQAKWKHGDPAVRLEAIAALGDDERDVLAQVATDDHDARVRRAAVARLSDGDVLAAVARNDADGGLRDAAVARLVALASSTPDAAPGALAALGALGRQRDLATLARSSAPTDVRHGAVAQLTEAKSLGGVARHAADAGTRLLALERLTDASELEAVAMNAEHADAAVAALDRLPDPTTEQLSAIAQRAKTKASAKRAKALLAARTAVPAAPSAPAVAYREPDQETARALTVQMESLAASHDAGAVRDGYAATRVAWVELLADADIAPAIVAQFEALSDRVRAQVASEEAVRAEEARRAAALRQDQADRVSVCERVEALSGADLEVGLASASEQWAALPAMPEAWAADLQRRFDEACRAAERRHEQAARTADLIASAPHVLEEFEGLLAADYAVVRGQVQALRRKWQAIGRVSEVDAALGERFAAATATFETREQDVRVGKQRQQEENLRRLQSVVQALEKRATAESLSLKDADTVIKDVKLAVGTMGPLPTPQDREDVTVRLQAVRAAVQPRLEELRNAEEWKRWANVQVQEDLCTKMEALLAVAEADPEKTANEMRALQEKWKPVAAAPRSQAEVLWTRFRTAQGQVYDKCKDYFAAQAVERQEALTKKEALCERAEAMSESTDWARTAEAMKTLQADWKAIGPVTRGKEKAVWERFRKACDAFFTRRQNDLKQRKQDWGENLTKKEALITEAEQLAQSTNWDQAASRLKALQVEWKTIGPVKKSKSDLVLGALSRGVRPVLRALQESRPGSDSDEVRRPRHGGGRNRGAGAGRRCAHAGRPLQQGAGGACALAAGARVAAARADAAGRTCERRAARPGDQVARCLHGRRPRSGRHGQAHGEAVREGRGPGAERRPSRGVRGAVVPSRAAGEAVARGPCGQHDGRRCSQAGRRRAATRGRSGAAKRAVCVDAIGPSAAGG